jgi:nucleolar complex protein 2
MGGAQKKKAIKFIQKGNLAKKIKQRNVKKKFQALKNKKKTKFEDGSDGPAKSKQDNNNTSQQKKDLETDMLDEMDVDDFLNGDFLDEEDSDVEKDVQGEEGKKSNDSDDEGDNNSSSSSSEEEDESALDPRYMSEIPTVEDSDHEAPEEEIAPEEDQEENSIGQRQVINLSDLVKIEKQAFEKHGTKSLSKLLKIFSDACRSGDANDAPGDILYDIQSSAVYNHLMLTVFRKCHIEFQRLVLNEETKKVDEKKWKKNALMIRRFFTSVCYMLEETTGEEIQLFLLRELGNYIVFITSCQKTPRRLLKALLRVWSKTLHDGVCMLAFVRLREMALQMPFPFMELCLKGIYLAYMRNTKFTNELTLPHHVLMGNCVVELYGLDLQSSYQHAFIYIRQLAISIRKTIVSPSAEAFKAVLNWQFYNQIRVWTAVVCAYPEENQLKPLVYPLCQLLFALIRLASTLKYVPMRFQCIKLLQQIAFGTNTFVPTSPVLMEILQMPPFNGKKLKKNQPSNGTNGSTKNPTQKELDLDFNVKFSKSSLDHQRVHDVIMNKLFELLQRECDVYKYSIGFPEFAVPLMMTLNKFATCTRVPRWKNLAKGLVENMKQKSDWMQSKRSNMDLCPKQIKEIDAFLKEEKQKHLQQLFEKDAAQLAKKIQQTTINNTSSTQTVEKEKAQKVKKRKQKASGLQIDEETVKKVKKMSLQEFQKAVDQVDAEDQVEDFQWSSDEEE